MTASFRRQQSQPLLHAACSRHTAAPRARHLPGRSPQRATAAAVTPCRSPEGRRPLDLPIAVGILAADGKIDPRALSHREFYGELSLGALRETPKLLPALIAGAKLGSEMILPSANALEASLLNGAKLRLMNHLNEVVASLGGKATPPVRLRERIVCRRKPAPSHRLPRYP